MQYLGAISKMTEWSQFFPSQTIQHHSNPSVCPNHWCQRNWTWMVLWKPTRPFRTNINIRGWNAKVGSQEIPGVTGKFGLGSTKWSRAKSNSILSREHTGHSKHPLPARDYTWTSPDGQYWNQTDYILCSWGWRSSIVSKNKTWSWLWLRSSAPYCKIQA